jgi:NADPH2:quinone reductase
MKAWMCREYGDLSVLKLEDVPSPEAGPGQVKLAMRACGVNFADSLLTAGKYQVQPEPPFSPGFEIAGDVVAVGDGVTDFKPGDRVMGMVAAGGYAEEVVADAAQLTPIPDEMDYVSAASFAVTYGTSYLAIAHRARLQAGEVLLVHGAAGGVGLTAVEIGKQLGATIIATAGGPEKLKIAQQAGADHLIDYRTEDIRERVKALTDGQGADVIYDPIGGDVFDASLRCVNFEGRILVIGFAGGRIQQIPSNHVMVKNVDIIGVNRGPYEEKRPEVTTQAYATLMKWLAEGWIRPFVSKTYPLEEAVSAITSVTDRLSTGKLVVTN